MTHIVHYMGMHLGSERSIAYLSEIPESLMPTVGSLYLFETQKGEPVDEYKIHAIFGENVVLLGLVKTKTNPNIYVSSVKGIGVFYFNAETIEYPLVYVGSSPTLQDMRPVRRLRSLRPQDHDRACLDYAFYFCGYSPSISDDLLIEFSTIE